MAAFVRVVEEGGFSAAARRMGLTPSAVSKLIARLEERLGARLLHRTTRRFSLTHEGVAFYQRSSRILREIEEAEQAITQLHAAPRGTLKVNAAVAFANSQIVPVLPVFLARYPDVHLELSVTDRVVDLIEDGVDVGIRINVRKDSSLIVHQLAVDRRIICAAPAYLHGHGRPLAAEDLLGHNCLTWKNNQGNLNNWPFRRPDGSDTTVTVAGNIEVDNGETLYEMTLAGLGIGRIAEFRVGADIKAGRLVPLLTDHHRADPLSIDAVYPHRRHLLPKVRAFVDFLVHTFSPAPPWQVDPGTHAETVATATRSA
jgi:DNA-binding transcriptional LysR family regulator